jgi:predicted phosphodiesterase
MRPSEAPRKPAIQRIVCISDTHGLHRKVAVPGGDLLIHAGDFMRTGRLLPLGRCRFRCQRLSHVGYPPDLIRVPFPKLRGNDAEYVMDKRFVIERLRQHEPELKAAGIVHLHVFGSVARDEATSASDVVRRQLFFPFNDN